MSDQPIKGPVFAAAGMSGLRMFTQDGRSWTHHQRVNKGRDVFETLCFNRGRVLTCYSNYKGSFFFSTNNGVDWAEEHVEEDGKNTFKFPFSFDGKFFASGAGWINPKHDPSIISSEDGKTWSRPRKIGGERGLIVFTEGDGKVVAGGTFGRKAVSTNGFDWEDAPDPDNRETFLSLAHGRGVFVGGGLHGLTLRSEDGINWTDRQLGEEGEHINSLAFDGEKFVGISQGATYMSPDGRQWKRYPIKDAQGPITAAFGAGVYIGVRWKGRMMISQNGVEWEDTEDLEEHLECIGFGELSG